MTAAANAHVSEKPGKRERNKADKRRRIIEAAGRLFEEKGFESTTTAEISATADVGTGTLYLYAESKEGLLVEVFKQRVSPTWEQGFALIDPEDPLLDQILVVFLHVARYHGRDLSLSRAFLKELMFTTGSVGESIGEFMHGLLQRLETVIEHAQDRGELRGDIDRGALSRNLFSIWHFEVQRFAGGRCTLDELEASIELLVRTALIGMITES